MKKIIRFLKKIKTKCEIFTSTFTKKCEQHTQRQQYVESKQNVAEEQLVDRNQQAAAQQDTRAQQSHQPVVKDKLPGRNDPCPCGSGKKFKNCHGRGLV